MFDSSDVVVIDNGSELCKSGLSEENTPSEVTPTVVGRSKYVRGCMLSMNPPPDAYVGDEAISKRRLLNLKYPIQFGHITNWDDMEKIWHYIFYKYLKVAPEEQPLLITECFSTPKVDRERMRQTMFETYNVPALALKNQPFLSLIASGRTTGTILEAGSEVTNIVSFHEGVASREGTKESTISGAQLTDYLMHILNERGYEFDDFSKKAAVKHIKEQICYVSQDLSNEIEKSLTSSALEVSYKLPDGSIVSPGSERFRCPELLFNPGLIGREETGIHDLIHESILKSPHEIRSILMKNVVLGGGSTMFDGLGERLQQELSMRFPANENLNVVANSNRRFSAWIGGAVFASHSNGQKSFINLDDYNERGPTIIHEYSSESNRFSL